MEYNLHKTVNLLRFLKVVLGQILIALIFVSVSFGAVTNNKKARFTPIKGVKNNKVAPIKISGNVTDQVTGEKLIGVSVKVKDTSQGALTDVNGNFTLTAPDNATLVISYIGYNTLEVPVSGHTTINIKLQSASKGLNEVIVVGYGTQKKVTVTGSVASVKGADLEKSPAVNLSNSLAGRLPGVTAVQASGEPGYDGSAIRIRGTNSLGNNDALVVIDGVPDRSGGLERINPADVESISVLKDASAAIYGSRAANGVILITTKHGKSGQTKLSYDFNQGFSRATVIPKMANAAEYATMNNELVLYNQIPAAEWSSAWAAFKQTGSYTQLNGDVKLAAFQPLDIQKYSDGSDPLGHPNTDWFGTTLKSWSPQTRHNVQLTGGSENVKFLTSIGYTNQDGYYKNSATGYKQYDLRINLDAKVNKYINTTFGITGREEARNSPTQSAHDIFRMLMRGKPTEQEVWPTGEPGPDIENGQNPYVITTSQTGYIKDRRDYFQTNGKVEILVPGIDGLKLTGTAAVDKFIQRNKAWYTPWSLYYWDHKTFQADGITPVLTSSVRSTFTDPRLSQSDENKLNVLLSGFVNYDRSFGDHTLNLMAAVSKETINDDYFSAYRRYFISPGVDQLFAGGDAEKTNSGGAYDRARLSYFGRVAYNYKQKYLAEFLWRYDGSYIFPESHRFGFFPGVLLGYNISQENFWKDNFKAINSLKIRGSYGQMGAEPYYNNTLQEYQYLSTYGFSSYILNNQVTKSLYETRVPNPNFTWEVANNYNLGIEGELFDGKIIFEMDYFYNKRTKILWQKQGSTPASTGISNLLPPENIGKVNNKGWEFKVGYNGKLNDFRYSVSVNGGYAKNKIIFQDEAPGAPSYQLATGHPIGSPLLYVSDGVFKDQAAIDANKLDYTGVTPQLRPGDLRFKDVNGDGKIDGNDRTRLDQGVTPTFTGGVSINLQYKGFDLAVLFQGATGGYLPFSTESGDIGNYLQYSYDHRWTVDNPSSVDPRIANRGDTWYSNNNTYFLRSSNYIRLKNVELGYNLPGEISKKIGMSNLRIYVSGLNLVTWDKMKIWDPESISPDGQYYPQAKILNTGVRVTF
ncbi:MAG: SusC/RagA family TonB-linked outer membrane protein [Mucilaginibacter sp.]|nr:SusC/RagA family TonB-linked outer membrane protein [Mucilaginibacter sp.]